MPNLTNYSLDQLRAATKPQILTAISSRLTAMTRRQLVLWLLDLDDQNSAVSDAPIGAYRKDGQVESQIEVERDAETGARVGGRVTTWTYFPTGEVDTVIISERNAADKEMAKRVIKHFTDGRQPTVIDG